MKLKGWIQLHWTDPIPPSTEEGLEGAAFAPYDFDAQSDTMTKLMATALTLKTYREMVEGRTNFVLEDYCHIPKGKGYLCRIGKEGMKAHEYIVSSNNEENIFIPVCIYHLAFGLRFPLHTFFSQLLCHFQLSLNQLLPHATRKIISFIWVCEYMKLPMTLRLFKSLFKLGESKNRPFVTFTSINGSMVAYQELNDLEEYKDKII